MEFGELGNIINSLFHRKPPLRERTENIVGADRRAGTRGATFPEGENLILGKPTSKPTAPNIEIMHAPPPPKEPRTAKDIEYGIG
ncbi:hypothetical protein HZB96_04470 [Candidatus Gottesmanbacteria bacterium]|nr:hypothetical protein [Candidatus Gottesmanbacteria bacterium]